MTIDYKKELENAAKGMILIHEPRILIKMIVRMLVHKVGVRHAAILLYEKDSNAYVLTVCRGKKSYGIPAEFRRMGMRDPLIKFFKERKNNDLFRHGVITYDQAKRLLNETTDLHLKKILQEMIEQMSIMNTTICIPSYFRQFLQGMLLMGRKRYGRKFSDEEISFFVALTSDVAMAIRNAQLFEELQEELRKKKRLFINTTQSLVTAIDAKDHYTRGHTTRVTQISLEIARRLAKKNYNYAAIDGKFLEDVQIAALLHDIGKIGIPEIILNKAGLLTIGERKKMQKHPLIGINILQPIKELEGVLEAVKYHHERYDGRGYPEGLAGIRVPFIAAIISGADAYDAMTTDRPYRRAMDKERVIKEIERAKGRQLNPNVADVLIELCKEGRI
jgi:HD-GYP domain-containing protein (c-di-GMP phosphodiesterase class II)